MSNITGIVKERSVHPISAYNVSRRVTPELAQKFAQLYQKGDSTVQIAKRFDLSPGAIYRSLKSFGVKIRPRRKISATMQQEFKELYARGLTTCEIAKRFSASPTSICQHLRRMGVKLRVGVQIPEEARKLTAEKAYLLGVLGPGDGYVKYTQHSKGGGAYSLWLNTIDRDFALEFKRCAEYVYGHRSFMNMYPGRVRYINGKVCLCKPYYLSF